MKPTPTERHCPPVSALQRLLQFGLPENEAGPLRAHLAECDACRRAWQVLQAETVASPPGPTPAPGLAAPSSSAAIAWSSEIGPIGAGGERAPAPRNPPALPPGGEGWDEGANGAASFAFLSPPQEAGELGWLAHYRITGLLGQGGMGFVFDAFDTQLHRRVALKVLRPELAANLSFRERFLQEARAAAALPDEYIITIYQVGMANDVPFLAMKFLHGQSLEQRLQQGDRLPIPEVLRIGREIALGLRAAHERGLIHRDIKPANLWLETPPEPSDSGGKRLSFETVSRVKILDFGLARPIHDARRLTATGLIVGTPSYLAPEQARGQPLDHRCDLFALGVVLYRLVTGILPFDGVDTLAQLTALAVSDPRPLSELAPDAPAGLRELIHQLLARDPAKRPPTAAVVAEMLRELEKDETLPIVRKAGVPPPPARKPSRRRWLLAGGAAGLLLLGGLLLWRGHRPAGVGSPGAASDKEPIKVGILFSLRGSMSRGGEAAHDAALVAIDELNKQGGLLGRSIEAVDGDGESDYRKFAELAEKFITKDRVCAIFGTRASSNRKAVLPIVEKYDNVLFYPMQFEGLEESPNIVYLGAVPNQQIFPAIDYAIDTLHKSRLFLVGSDYVFPRAANAILRDHVRNRVSIVDEKYVPFGGTEVSEVIQAIQKHKPDLIVNTINGDSNVAFFRALHQAQRHGERTPVLSFSMGENDLLSMGEVGKGHYAAWSYFQSIPGSRNRDFVAKFRRSFGGRRVVSDPMETVYFGVHLWAQAVQAAGTVEPSAVRAAIKARSFDAPEGRVRIDRDTRYTWRMMRLGHVLEGGQFEILWDTQEPLRPQPFPSSRSRDDWKKFLRDLYKGWGDRWVAPPG
jgi:urea transport system substrate-binding protein